MLVERELVTPAQLGEALLQQSASGKRLGALLVELGALGERSLAEALSEQLGLPIVDLRHEEPRADAVAALPESLARSLGAMPLRRVDGALDVAVADPLHPGLGDQLAAAAGTPVRLHVAPASEVRRMIDHAYRALSGLDRHVQEFEAVAADRAHAAAETPLQLAVDENAPIVQVVNLLVTQALRDRASDIHLEPQDDRVRVRYRIDGALHDVVSLPTDMGPALVSRIKIMAGMNIVEKRRSQDGQIETSVDGRSLDIRVATTPVIWGEKTVLRLLDKSRSLLKMGDLGMSAETHAEFSEVVRSPFGMVICAGPTGSGKTTTLYATLAQINQTERNIMTIEDPVEYILPSVNQIQINEQADVTFAGGLKAILRQDPDIILVGEIRDVETARIAVQSALTGHFVLSSLHATDAAAALHRFLDMGIESFLVASSVLAVVGQRLVRRICVSCKAPYRLPPEELAFYEKLGGPPKDEFFHGEGCNFCAGTGYQDRIGVYEMMHLTDEMKQLIVGNAVHHELRELAVAQGMRPLRDEALRLVAGDVTTVSEILRSVYPL
ncbi:MAG: GspE/PulE family protein [Acidimicrobiia bacterium]|nr:GspE/PulE family protein [Acidimicrobiia bacterium]